MITAKKIVKLLNINVNAQQYNYDSEWFHPLKRFPGALIDKDGYVIFKEKLDYEDSPYLTLKKDVHLVKDIKNLSGIPGYIKFTENEKKLIESLEPEGLIKNSEQLYKNLEKVEYYLTAGTEAERAEMLAYLKRGTCFISYNINNEYRFATSKFIGYINNTLKSHNPSATDGRDTNRAISAILNQQPKSDKFLEEKYLEFCTNLGFIPQEKGGYGVTRKYWLIELKDDFYENTILWCEFPEGKIIERIHKSRERNNMVIQIAKANFKKRHGKLFCQICGFDFEQKYGNLGLNFIEAHHTIAVCDMAPNHVTKPEEIAMLCSNCHSMVHKKRPWLTMKELSNIIN